MSKTRVRMLSILMASTLMLPIAGVANANPSLESAPPAPFETVARASNTDAEIQPFVELLAPYVRATENGFELDAPESVTKQVPEDILIQLHAYWNYISDGIEGGKLRLVNGEIVENTPSSLNTGDEIAPMGFGDIHTEHFHRIFHWWGQEFRIDSWAVNKIAGGSSVVSVLGGVATPVAAVIASYALVCQKSDGWSYIYQAWAGPPVCNPIG